MERMIKIGRMIIDEAKALGAQTVVCRISESEKKEFNVDGGEFSLMRTLFNRGVSVTVLKDQRKGSVNINRFDEAAVKAAVRDCIAASESAEPDPAWEYAKGPAEKQFCSGSPECDTDLLFSRTKELMADIAEKHPKILMEQMITSHDFWHGVFMTSDDITYYSKTGSYNFSLMYSAHEGEKATSFFGSGIKLAKLDKPVIETGFIERELSAIEKQLDPESVQGKFTGPVIMAPSAADVVLGTVLGNFVSDGSLIDGTSIWKDKLNTQVADERITVSLTPSADWALGSEDYTGEGFPSEDYDVIKDGKLVSFMLSQYAANKTGGKRCGNTGWNVCVPAGEKSVEEIIAGIDRGVLVLRFSGGQPSPSGEFSGVAKNSFLIENGKIAKALNETMISGNVTDMLMDLRAISSDVLYDGSNAIPYMAFNGVTISGK